jgi:NitT/TauT family transport system substrate-binding protein
VVKLHGDVESRAFAFTPSEITMIGSDSERVLRHYLGGDVIIVGHGRRDYDVNRAIEREGGFAPDIWLLADAGFSTYATTVETMQATIDESPEVVRCFVEGSAIGWANYLYGDPSAANALIQADNTDMSDEQIAFSIEKMKEYGIVDSGDALDAGIGAMTTETIEGFYNKMVDVGVVEAGLDIGSIYTTEFSNTGVALGVKAGLMGN